MFRWLCTIPFGTPVVPLVKGDPGGRVLAGTHRRRGGRVRHQAGPFRGPDDGAAPGLAPRAGQDQ